MKRLLALLCLLCVVGVASAKISIGGPIAPDGMTQVDCDLPVSLLKHNISSRGLGCCVFRSIEYASIWQQVPQLHGMPEWMVQKGIPGGGYPEKADKLIRQISKDRGMPVPGFIQYQGQDPAILMSALRSGRLPCITYCGRDPHYNGATVAHMTNIVAYDSKADLCGVQDNNHPKEIVWMSVNEFLARWKGNGGGWALVLLDPGPPPPPAQQLRRDQPMKTQRLLAFLALVSAFLVGPLLSTDAGSWGPRGCSTVGRANDYQWKQLSSDPGRSHLFLNGRQVGAYDHAGRYYRAIDARGNWGPKASAGPVAVPASECDCGCESCAGGCDCSGGLPCSESCLCVAGAGTKLVKATGCTCHGEATENCNCPLDCPCQPGCIKNFGVNMEKISKRETYSINGEEVSKKQVEAVLAGDQIPDDANKLRLTVIGPDKDRQRVLADIGKSKAFDPLREKLVIKEYPPDHWAVKGVGFKTTGTPTIYLQAPGGKVLHRQDEDAGGAEKLAEAISKVEAIRKPDPNYKAEADPDLRKPALADMRLMSWAGVGGAGLFVLWLLFRRPVLA